MRLFGAQKRWKGDHWTNRAWERPPGATSRSRCVPLLRATFLKRRHEVARVLITPNSLRWPWSDLSERPTKVAPDPERPVGATAQSRSRFHVRRHTTRSRSDLSQRPSEVAPEAWSDLSRATGRNRSPSWFPETRNRSRSDLSQRPSEVAPEAWSDLSERQSEVAPCFVSARTCDFSRAFWSFHYARFYFLNLCFKHLL